MKKFVLITIASAAMIYAACSRPHYYGADNNKPAPQKLMPSADSSMGGDAMKKDSTLH